MEDISGRVDILRDPNTGAIVSVDSDGHRAAVEASKIRRQAKEQLYNNSKDINSIREDLTELKTLVKALLTKTENNGR